MCGIAGIISWEERGVCAESLSQLSLRLTHRGPDDHGFLGWSPASGAKASRRADVAEHQTLGLATRRLSIIDLSESGAQPMTICDGRYWLAYNGEVYNYVELRTELERLGCRFRSTSDTEVVLYALQEWGGSALNRFVGMFALAFLDTETGHLLLARDPFGIKPLYFVRSSSTMVFASELAPLRSFLPHPTVNARRALEYLRFGRSDESQETMIDGAESLPPGHSLSVRISSKEIGEPAPYWELTMPSRIDISFPDAAAMVRDKFLRNVELHLRSDVAVGACLSGGVDSSSCAAAMRYVKGSSLDIHTFTYSAGDASIDETRWAGYVSAAIRSHSHEAKGSAQDLARELDALIGVQGEPFATTSIYAQQLVFRLVAASGIKVVLDGQGADEMFGGYALFFAARIAGAIKQGRLVDALRLARAARSKGGFASAPLVTAQYFLPQRLQDSLRHAIGRDVVPAWVNHEWWEESFAPRVSGDRAEDLLRSELRTSLMGSLRALLRYEDRNSMGVSVESRLPFLTVDLVEFLLGLPDSYLISADGTTKAVFRQAMRGIVPDRVLDRTDKISFQTPEFHWLRELTPWATRILTSELAKSCPLVDFERSQTEWDRAMRSPRHYRPWMWRWLNLVRWAEINSVSWPERPRNVA